MNHGDRIFAGGRANPEKFGWPLRSSAGERPDPKRLEQAARLAECLVSFWESRKSRPR